MTRLSITLALVALSAPSFVFAEVVTRATGDSGAEDSHDGATAAQPASPAADGADGNAPAAADATAAHRARAAEPCRTQFRFFEMGRHCDVTLIPLNGSLGYGMTFDAEDGVGSLTVGLDFVTVTWEALFVTLTELRASFFFVCTARGEPCGISADFFVAPRVGAAFYLGRNRLHQLTFGVAAGWGTLGKDWHGPVGDGDGGLVLSASIRYALWGSLGVEVQAMFPATGDLGDRYPVALLFNALVLPINLYAVVD